MPKLTKAQQRAKLLTTTRLNIFIGYDERQDLAYRTCRESIEQTASRPVSIYPLKHRELMDIGLFTRTWNIDRNGRMVDTIDGLPFSTHFAFTRFLTPHYAKYLGVRASDFALFVDSDFVFLKDCYGLIEEISGVENYTKYPVWCVKHEYNPENIVKMDNQFQSTYNKKLWSSLMLFNLSHAQAYVSKDTVNTSIGRYLHQFAWLPEESLGTLNESWNFIPDHSEPRAKFPSAIHYTEGVPLLKPGCRYSEVFNNYLRDYLTKAAENPTILSHN